MRRIRRHLTFANVASAIALFVALTGGTAIALGGANTVFTDDIANDTQPASGGNPAGGLVAADLRAGSVGSSEAGNNTLTGADINESTLQGVNATCPAGMTLVGTGSDLCVDNTDRAFGKNWAEAAAICADAGFRLPSVAEALEGRGVLAINGGANRYWTDGIWDDSSAGARGWTYSVAGGGIFVGGRSSLTLEVRCVATPSDA